MSDPVVDARSCDSRDHAEQRKRELTCVEVRVGVAIVDNDAVARRCLTASRIKKECLRGSVADDGVLVREASK
ncbi:MAG: hypothetical protein ACJAR2_002657 [Ilumatobacter sp.]